MPEVLVEGAPAAVLSLADLALPEVEADSWVQIIPFLKTQLLHLLCKPPLFPSP